MDGHVEAVFVFSGWAYQSSVLLVTEPVKAIFCLWMGLPRQSSVSGWAYERSVVLVGEHIKVVMG